MKIKKKELVKKVKKISRNGKVEEYKRRKINKVNKSFISNYIVDYMTLI